MESVRLPCLDLPAVRVVTAFKCLVVLRLILRRVPSSTHSEFLRAVTNRDVLLLSPEFAYTSATVGISP